MSVPISNLLPPPREDCCFDKHKAQETYDFMGKYIKTKGREPRKAINVLTKFIPAQEESDVKAARIRMVKNMLKAGLDADIIYRATGLSTDEYDDKELVVCKRTRKDKR